MADFSQLLSYVKNENISESDAEKVLEGLAGQHMADLNIPSSISVENTLAEINSLTARLYELHNNNKRDPIVINKLMTLLELKIKIQGMMNLKPDVQAMIDSEINTYKRRFLELAETVIDGVTLASLCDRLTQEGL